MVIGCPSLFTETPLTRWIWQGTHRLIPRILRAGYGKPSGYEVGVREINHPAPKAQQIICAVLSLFLALALLAPSHRAFAQQAAAPQASTLPVVILALGDSLSAGYNLPAEAAFPVQLEKALREKGHAVRVINGGVSGDTTAGGVARLDWMLADTPSIALVELGANDALRGLAPDQTEANLEAILTRLQQRGVTPLLIGMLAPPNMGKDYGQAFNSLYPRLAERHGVALYPFFLDGVAARPEVLQADGMHPTADGVAEIVRRILPTVEALLPPVQAANPKGQGETQ